MSEKKLLLGSIILSLMLCGCFERQPTIPGYHWCGGNLYGSTGLNVASVVIIPPSMGESQACIFLEADLNYSACTYWETGQQAYDWIENQFKERKRR